MDPAELRELFAPFGAVSIKRMFGGAGVYADGLCFAIESGGEVFLKVDADNEAAFRDAGSSPFVYDGKDKPVTVAYWRLVASAYDDEDELKRWAALGFDAARRAAETKAAKTKKSSSKR